MKRSEINKFIVSAENFFNQMNFKQPPFSRFTKEDLLLEKNRSNEAEIFKAGLGWDITDFGSGNFLDKGLLLFTLRNGVANINNSKKYAEKIMIVEENQETPLHFHWSKMEDIINRGGGNLILEAYNSDAEGGILDTDIRITVDGIERSFKAGEKIVLIPGQSITIPQMLYHKFYGEKGKGKVLVGEVSMVNDDSSDNRFYEPAGRFSDIEEDEEPYRLLVQDYAHC